MSIRLWELKDVIYLRKMILEFLKSQDPFGGEVLPIEENVRFFLDLGFRQIRNNKDPHLVYEEDGELLGYIQLGAAETGLRRKYKTCEMFGIYTKPEYEHRFISIDLVRACMPFILENKYLRGYSTILITNKRIQKNVFFNPAIWPTRIFAEWDLTADPQFEGDTSKPRFVERQK